MLASFLFFAANARATGLQEDTSPVLLLNAWDCNTLADLNAWKAHRSSEIAKYVPKEFQESSIRSMQGEFDKRATQLHDEAAPVEKSSVIIAEEPPAKTLPIFLPSEGDYSSAEDLSHWRARKEQQIYDLVPDDHLEIAQGSLAREYNKRAHAESVQGRLPALLFLPSAQRVASIADLQVWKSEQTSRVNTLLPAEFRSYALTSVDQEYTKHLDRLRLSQESPHVVLPAVEEVLGEQEPTNSPAWAAVGAAVCAASAGLAVMAVKRRSSSNKEEEEGVYIMVA